MPRSKVLLFGSALAVAAFAFAGAAGADDASVVAHVNAASEWVSTGFWAEPGATYAVSAVGRSYTTMPNNPSFRPPPGNAGGCEGESGPGGQIYICTNIPGFTCAVDGAPFGQLVGNAGGVAFSIGDASTFTVPASASAGYLELAVNDYLGYYSDNSGGYTVTLG
jgi:hypothetical protein